MHRILLLEDEPALATSLKISLGQLGDLKVDHVRLLSEAEKRIQKQKFDLYLLDRKLPDGDSLTLLTEIRKRDPSALILMLSAMGTVADRIAGLREGADDYLPKPFSLEELTARVEALRRRLAARTPAPEAPVWQLEEKQLTVAGNHGPVQLTPLEYKLVAFLVAHEGEIVSREELLKEVWGFQNLPQTRTVDLFMSRLRKLFESNPEAPEHFQTVRGAGYRFTRLKQQ